MAAVVKGTIISQSDPATEPWPTRKAQDAQTSGNLVTGYEFLQANNQCKKFDAMMGGMTQKYLALKWSYSMNFMLKATAAEPMHVYWECWGTAKVSSSATGTCFDDSDCPNGSNCIPSGECVEYDDDAYTTSPTDTTNAQNDASGTTVNILEEATKTVWDALPAKLNPDIQALQLERAWNPTEAFFPKFENNYGRTAKSWNMFFDVFSLSDATGNQLWGNHISLLVPDGTGPEESVFFGQSSRFHDWVANTIRNKITYLGQVEPDASAGAMGKFDIIRYFLGKYWVRVRRKTFEAWGGKDYGAYYGGAANLGPIATEDSGLGVDHLGWTWSHRDIMKKIAPESIGADRHQILAYDFIFPKSPNDWTGAKNWKPKHTLQSPDLPYYIHQIEITNMTPSTADVLGEINNLQYMLHLATKQANDIPFMKLLRDRVEIDLNSSGAGNPKYKYDHVFEFPVPFSEEEKMAENPSNPLYAKIDYTYNFYHHGYEKWIARADISEADLPHLLMTLVENESKHDTSKMFSLGIGGIKQGAEYNIHAIAGIKSQHREHITLMDNIPGAMVDVNKMGENKIEFNADSATDSLTSNKVAQTDTQDYFTVWTDTHRFIRYATNAVTPEWVPARAKLDEHREKMINQVFLPNSTYKDLERMKGMFPMVVDLRFSPIKPPPKEESVMDAMMNPPDDTAPIWYTFLRYIISEYAGYWTETTVCPATYQVEGPAAMNLDLLEFDFYDFLEDAGRANGNGINYLRNKTNPETPGNEDNTVIVPPNNDTKLAHAMFLMHPPVGKSNHPRKGIWEDSITQFREKFDEIVLQKTRNYVEVLAGKTAQTEVLFWKIDKYRVTGTGANLNEPVTSYYLPNMPDIDEIKLLDTQVKYDTGYIYTINAITMVFGTQYSYRNLKESVLTNKNSVSSPASSGELPIEGRNVIAQAVGREATAEQMITTASGNGWQIPTGEQVLWPHSLPDTVDTGGEITSTQWFTDVWGKHFMSGDLGLMGTSPDVGWFTNLMLNATTAGDNSFPHEFAPFTPGGPITIFDGIRGWTNPQFDLPDSLPSSIRPITNYSLVLEIFSRPSVKLMEVPYYTLDTRIMDKPPLPPIVSLTPYKGVNNKFLVSFDPGTGRTEQEAIALLPSDDVPIEKQKIAQNAGVPPIFEFASDDTPAFFELFRIDKPELEEEINSNRILQYYPPTSYESFKDSSLHKRISTGTGANVWGSLGNRVSSISVHEKVQPNKKYYYTFRSVDVHENISNPSPIFEVEIVDDGGTVYMTSKVYNFEIPENTNIKSMKKYINVIPTIEQVMHDGDSMDPPSLGVTESSIFDESTTFKIRLTSKQTGKKLDLNLNFDSTSKGYDS